jgi:hypothetical protein
MAQTGARIFGILTLIVVATMLALLIKNPSGTGSLINGFTGFWRDSLNAALGKPS